MTHQDSPSLFDRALSNISANWREVAVSAARSVGLSVSDEAVADAVHLGARVTSELERRGDVADAPLLEPRLRTAHGRDLGRSVRCSWAARIRSSRRPAAARAARRARPDAASSPVRRASREIRSAPIRHAPPAPRRAAPQHQRRCRPTPRRHRRRRRRWMDRAENGEGPPHGGGPSRNRRRPTLPGGLPPSTIGAGGLNFRVRNGNGCDPAALATGNLFPRMEHP